MALREDQIVRYGRQILLRELGGRGQERLLTSPVRVRGSGPAIDDAVAWLLAGGSPVELDPQRAPGGFLTGVGLDALNPDAAPGQPAAIELVQRGVPSAAESQVVIGAGVAFRGPAACKDCWAQTLEALGREPEPLAVGSLAALAVQRLVLGWADPLGLIRWTGERFEGGAPPTCERHRYSALQG